MGKKYADQKDKYMGHGEIVRARITGDSPVEHYWVRGSVLSGRLEKLECCINSKIRKRDLPDEVIVRICLTDSSFRLIEKAGFNGVTSNFITSEIPEGFDHLKSEETMLYGIWKDDMKKGINVPTLGYVSHYYNPGYMSDILHFVPASRRPFIFPYVLHKGQEPDLMRKSENSKHVRGTVTEIRMYLTRYMESRKVYPYVMTVDEHIDFDAYIRPELKKSGLHILEMESPV